MKSDNPNSGGHFTDVCHTLDASTPDPAKNQGGIAIVQNVPIGIGRDAFSQGQNAKYGMTIEQDRHSIAFAIGNGQSDNTGLHEIPGALNCMHDQQAILTRSSRKCIVRRLTPLECERLQGYPDGWTDIGSWTDSYGKRRESTDSARYKALGNSIALPPWVFVLSRLTLACGAECTMGSLFDGIGGFPLIWERLNGAGSCLWASEIDEFAIAITKKRFCSEAVSESRKEV